MPSRHRFLEPIHNVKEERFCSIPVQQTGSGFLQSWKILSLAPSVAAKLRLVARYAALAVLARVQISSANLSLLLRDGGAYRDRTDDLMLAKQPLSQLS